MEGEFSGAYRFSDATNPDQAALFGSDAEEPALEGMLVARFHGRSDPVPVEEIDAYVVCETPYLYFKKQALVPMEQSGAIAVLGGSKRRRGTFPAGTLIDFRKGGS